MKVSKVFIFILLILVFSTTTIYGSDLNNQINDLSKQIITSMTKNKALFNKDQKVTVAVIEFVNINGQSNLLGRSVSEQLTIKLYLTERFNIIEQGLINKVLADLQLNTTSVFDPESAKNLGKILGVSAIVTGTITELDKSIHLNTLLIRTETGLVFDVATVELKKDTDVMKLLSKLNEGQKNQENISSTQDTKTSAETRSSTSAEIVNKSVSSEEAKSFVNSIRNAIANRKPDYQDDFSDPSSGWDSLANGKMVGYINGEYFIEVLPGSTMSARSSKLPFLSDFVAELDWRFISSNPNDVWQVKYRSNSGKRIDISPDGRFGIVGSSSDSISAFQNNISLKPGKELNQLVLITKGPKIAMYVNGILAVFATDPYYDSSENGRLNFWIGNEHGGEKPFRIQLDNLKIWDISDSKKVNSPQNPGLTTNIKQVPSQYPTIQAAVDAAGNGDEVVVAPGTYQEIIDFKGKNIIVRSTNPDDPKVVTATIINGDKFKYMKQGSNNSLTSNSGFSVVVFRNGETSAAVLEGFTITKGYGTFTPTDWSDGILAGGGIFISNKSAPTIRKNIITNNWGVIGGGIGISDRSNPIICFNTISNNTSEATGGGIIIWNNCHPVINNNIFDGNLGKGGGGGLQIDTDCSAKIYGNTFKNNYSTGGNGGAILTECNNIFKEDGKTPITDSDGINIFIDNQAKKSPNIQR